VTWTTLGRDKFRTSYCGDVWLLVATPKGPKPWLLHTERQVQGRPARQQEIGAREPGAARRAAEVWLGLSARYGLAGY
jgi:hypothetical protein